MYVFCNPHPKGLIVGDCVKRAITLATDEDYMAVGRALNRYKKKTNALTYNEDRNWKVFVEKELKGRKLSFPAVKGQKRMNGRRFCKAYSKGTYILSMAGHLSICINGKIYDTWDSTSRCVYTAWQIDSNKINRSLFT